MLGRIVSLEYLLVRLKWSLTKIDQETQDGTIELHRKGGRTAYRLHKHFVNNEVFDPRSARLADHSRNLVGHYVNRKNANRWG